MKTANSGYLTRRLVDVAQDCIIVEPDCGTERGLTVRAVMDGGEVVAGLEERTLGRTTAEDVLDPVSNQVIVGRNTLIEEPEAERIETSGVESVKIRSVLTCESRVGVCAACYGRDLARGTPVNIGEAVGVIAAQSIGEPGTQLTMRTFHIGGAAQRGAEVSNVEASHDGTVSIKNRNVVQNSQGYPVVMSRNCEMLLQDDKGPRACPLPGAVRRPAAGRRRRYGQAQRQAGGVGSLHAADHHGAARPGGIPGHAGRRDHRRADGRGDRPDLPRGGGLQAAGEGRGPASPAAAERTARARC